MLIFQNSNVVNILEHKYKYLFVPILHVSCVQHTYNNNDTDRPVKAPDEAIFKIEPTAEDKDKHLNITNKQKMLLF